MRASVAQAKARFSEMIDAARAGEPVIVTRNGEPVVAVVPVPSDPDDRERFLPHTTQSFELSSRRRAVAATRYRTTRSGG